MVIFAAAVLCLALLVPSVASGRLIPQKGITKVRLGNSQSKLRERLPTPVQAVRTTGIVSGLPSDIWIYNGLEIEFEGGNTVTRIYTTRVFERTKKGAGVGTPKRLLRKLHPKLKCRKGPSSSCQFGNGRRVGSKLTVFQLRDGRVESITILRILL